MGTYTTNKNLFMPSVGEQGWGDLVNGNFTTIDNFLKPITESGGTYTFTGNHVGNQSGGSVSATSITNSGTLTQTGISTFTGKITANGGIGTKALTTTSISNSGNMTNTGTLTSTGKIYANGGLEIVGDVVGNVAGKIAISSIGDEPNNLKVCDFNCAKQVLSFLMDRGSSGNMDVTSNDYTLTKYNTSIIEFTPGDTEMKNICGTATCTISVQAGTASYNAVKSGNLVVKNTTTNTTVLSQSFSFSNTTAQTTTFTRVYTDTYNIKFSQTDNWSGAGYSWTIIANEFTIPKYVA